MSMEDELREAPHRIERQPQVLMAPLTTLTARLKDRPPTGANLAPRHRSA